MEISETGYLHCAVIHSFIHSAEGVVGASD